MYCETCKHLFDESVQKCPFCRSRKVRQPENGDFCVLTEQPEIWRDMMRELLESNGIPFAAEPCSDFGIAVVMGAMFSKNRYLIPYERYDEALALLADFENGMDTTEEATENDSSEKETE